MSKPEQGSDLVSLFTKMGLTKAKAEEATKAPKSAAILANIVETNGALASGVDEKKATLLSALSIALSKSAGLEDAKQDYAVTAILDSKLTGVDQVSG